MPRPRLLPGQRRRAAEACNFCREAKKKCSGTAPCSHCLRRGIAAQCSISVRPRGLRPGGGPGSGSGSGSGPDPAAPARTPPSREERPDRQSAVSPLTTRGRDRPDPGYEQGGDFCPPSPTLSRQSAAVTAGAHRHSDASSMSAANPHARMLLNLRGERVFIGGAASLSFLQLVRGVVADQIGPSQFSHNAQSDTMLEKESPSSSRNLPSYNIVDLDVSAKIAFAQCYRAVTEGFIDVFGPSEIERAFTNVDDGSSSNASPQRRAALDLVVAIGAQAKSAATARDIGLHYFRQAQHRSFNGMLEDPDIDMVRSFLLMAFYLLGECRRNAAFMYLGIATRAAVALGLHSRESYADLTDPKDNLRLRVWISLRIVDMLANSILGRPAATAGLHSDINSIIADMKRVTQDDDDVTHLIASHQIVSIINGIVDTIYEKKELSLPLVEQLLSEIETWAKDLPKCLRTASLNGETSGPMANKGAIGSIHVSCLYYFAVTLVTRPILISTLTAPPASGGLVQSHLASACLDAAVFLVQTCVDARKANLLYGNMCIMKALVFAAGLVLGFEIFAKRSIDYDIESAFSGARDVLSFLATQSPQAAHYYDILTLLANAITKQREKIASKGRSRYVSKIFTLNDKDAAEGDAEGERDWQPSSSAYAPAPGEDGVSWLSGNRTPAEPSEAVFLGWDSLDISQWDSFPFVP